ncbi:MAG TPA: S1 RNA-binding domain-containing protein, partial [Candidatus Wallbacteria bacterium]|nr:S1 RNA-binding domain-containing protein [Candidatus Wallbacteria bacterium]
MTENFADLFEKSTVSKQKIHYGMKVNAKIVGMDESSVFVDIGAKTDGYVEKAELIDGNGNFNYKIGDYIELYIVTNKESELKLSRALSGDGSYNVIKDAFDRKITVSGKVKSLNKGGYEVTVMGKRAFCPISQMDIKKIDTPEKYVGSVFNFKVSSFEEEKKNIVLSRRPVLEQEQKEAIDKLIASLKEVDVISGKVTKVSEIGAFIDLGSQLEGMIHVSELAWTRVAHASEVVKPGDIVTAKVLKVEHAEGKRFPRISLSLKQLSLHPWESVASRVKQGDVIKGKVTRCADFGAFVELFPGVEGLIHISEITGEKLWELPLWEDYCDAIKSDIADLKNVGGRPAGAITAGTFLSKFAWDYPWVHLDIAGPSWLKKDRPYTPKGASGVGVRLLIRML